MRKRFIYIHNVRHPAERCSIRALWTRFRCGLIAVKIKPHPPGACAFLDADGACRIYADRPYVCRTQGLPLRWFAAGAGGATVELRDICGLNESDTPIEALSAESCWLIGPVEDNLGELQASVDAGKRGRVALRDLFQEKERIVSNRVSFETASVNSLAIRH